jgi:DNA-binding NtrC family response regulator
MNIPIKPRPRLLLVDDDPLIVDTLCKLLAEDFEIVKAGNRAAAIAQLRNTPQAVQLALIDLGLPPLSSYPDEGFALISELLAYDPDCKIIVLSGRSEESYARQARTLGALEFLVKPAPLDTLRQALRNALQSRDNADRHDTALSRIVGDSDAITKTKALLQRLAQSRFPVLIEGESGVGKEMVAQALHELSVTPHKSSQRFIALNCAAISPGLIEATLFGHVRGAFTGAQNAQAGYFEEAGEGTLFLDEIGELPLELQPKLLRALENGEYQRVGETRSHHVRARILAATNRNLQREVQAGRFRADLFHRLSVLRVRIPPLRETGDDRALLLEHYTQVFSAQMKIQPFSLSPEAMRCWLSYDFPGNVRELRNIVIRLLTRHAGDTVSEHALQEELESDQNDATDARSAATSSALPSPPPETLQVSPPAVPELNGGVCLPAVLRQLERDYIAAALRKSRGNMSLAAKLLGINRSTLYNRIETLERNGASFGNNTEAPPGGS